MKLRSCVNVRRFGALVITSCILASPATLPAAVPEPISYQGVLKLDNTPVTGLVDLEFRLFDAATGGLQQGPTIAYVSEPIEDGLISLRLNFPASVYTGAPLWLQVEVRQSGSPGPFTPVGPRIPLRSVPYAHRAGVAAVAEEAQNALMLNNRPVSDFAAADHLHASLNDPLLSFTVLRALSPGRLGFMMNSGIDYGMHFFTNEYGSMYLQRPDSSRSGLLVDATVDGVTAIQGSSLSRNQSIRLEAGYGFPVVAGGSIALTAGPGSGGGPGGSISLETGAGSAPGISGPLSMKARQVQITSTEALPSGSLLKVEGDAEIGSKLGFVSGYVLDGTPETNIFALKDTTNTAILRYDTRSLSSDVELQLGKAEGGTVFLRPLFQGFGPGGAQQGESLSVSGGNGKVGGSGNGGSLRLSGGSGSPAFLFTTPVGGKGGNVVISGGNATGTGNWDGGDVRIIAGTGRNSGRAGAILIETPRIRIGSDVPPAAGRVIDTTSGAHLTTGGTWTNASDAALKTEFTSVDPRDVLRRLLNLPITKFRYIAEEQGTMRLGPTAQDFHSAFGLGNTDKAIATVDADGVALAAIQGLHQETSERLSELEAENAALRSRLEVLEEKLNQLLGRP